VRFIIPSCSMAHLLHFSSQPSDPACIAPNCTQVNERKPEPPTPEQESTKHSFLTLNTIVSSQNVAVTPTKPIPPPTSRPRKRDTIFDNQRVVYPPKESCFGYVICLPSSTLLHSIALVFVSWCPVSRKGVPSLEWRRRFG